MIEVTRYDPDPTGRMIPQDNGGFVRAEDYDALCTPRTSSPYSRVHRRQFIASMLVELDHAYAKHGAEPWGRHEFYGVLKEEFDEIWEAIKSDAPIEFVLKEVVEVAAMCLRYAETPDRYMGPHPLPLPSRLGKDVSERILNELASPVSITELVTGRKA